MFSRDANNKLVGRQEPLFWTELPEFSHLQSYLPPCTPSSLTSSSRAKELPLKTQIKLSLDRGDGAGVRDIVREGFMGFLAGLSGFKREDLDLRRGVGVYGVDSLSGVGCQYWFWRGEFFLSFLFFFGLSFHTYLIPPSHLSFFSLI